MKTIDYLYAARDNLEKAHDAAGMGTGMMIQAIIDELDNLIQRTERINDESDE